MSYILHFLYFKNKYNQIIKIIFKPKKNNKNNNKNNNENNFKIEK